MCLIVSRNAGVVFPEDKLEAATLNNPDGYGLVVFDRGKIEVSKHFNPNGNDPDEVLKRMQDLKDLKVLLHLRWKTNGHKQIENCHPFKIFRDAKDTDYQVYLMHNGVMSEFCKTDDDGVDSDIFGQAIVRPLLERARAFSGEDMALADPFVSDVIHKYAGSGNRLVLCDTLGNEIFINRKSGLEGDGWWCSNNSYFTRYGRTTKNDPYWSYSGNYSKTVDDYCIKVKDEFMEGTSYADYVYKNGKHGYGYYLREASLSKVVPFEEEKSKNSSTTTPSVTKSGGTSTPQATNVLPPVNPDETSPVRMRFVDYFRDMCPEDKELDKFSLSDVTQFSADNIDELVEVYPEAASALIMDLIEALYKKGYRAYTKKKTEAVEEKVKVSAP